MKSDTEQVHGGHPSPQGPSVESDLVFGLIPGIRDLLPEEPLAALGVAMLILLAAATIAYLITRWIIIASIRQLIRRSGQPWATAMLDHGILARLAPLAPLIVLHKGVLALPYVDPALLLFLQRVLVATMLVIGVRSLYAVLNAINSVYSRYPVARGRPIKGYLQVVKIVAAIAVLIVVIAAFVGQSPWYLLSGLGAMTAVILLIFRDTLLSLVAGIQLTANDLIRVGDWIEMPQFEADGDVIDITLNVVKVQNFDRTLTVIPAHKFLEHSFRNWRSMFEGGGRRIKRSLRIDMNTIRFLRPEEIDRFRRFVALRDYITRKVEEIEQHNATAVEREYADIVANGRHLTNIGTLRAYITSYLRRHPGVHQDLILLIRQLEPTAHGLPMEIYVFTNDTRWVEYEAIQADIFDHILAVMPEFGLRVYQEPAGSDLARLGHIASAETEQG